MSRYIFLYLVSVKLTKGRFSSIRTHQRGVPILGCARGLEFRIFVIASGDKSPALCSSWTWLSDERVTRYLAARSSPGSCPGIKELAIAGSGRGKSCAVATKCRKSQSGRASYGALLDFEVFRLRQGWIGVDG